MHPTAAVWPTEKRVTASPTAVTRPTISWPGTHGYTVFFHSLRAWWRSEWQTPQNCTAICTSRGPTARRGIVVGRSGLAAEAAE